MTTELTKAQREELAEKFNDAIEEYSYKSLKQEPRDHLGASEIAYPCTRQGYYKFRWMKFEEYNGRMLRLFKRGHREEERFISYLEGIGCTFHRFDENGKQFRFSSIMGHYGGSCDGIIGTNPWYPELPLLAEFKTHNTGSFGKYLKEGVAKSKPQHFGQMSQYGVKLGLKYALYFPENKNDDDIQVSIIELDWNLGNQLERKAEEIITAKEPPRRISDNPSYQECTWCTFKGICHNEEIPIKNCRSCRNAMPTNDATWTCGLHGLIPSEFVPLGCDQWMPI